MENEARWSIDFLIALPLMMIIIVVCIGVTIGCFLWMINETYQQGFALVVTSVAALVTLAVILGTLAGFYPYEKEYHAYIQKVGTVKSVSKRIVGGSDGAINEKFVVKYTDGRTFGCLDTRCALVKPGNTLVLTCIRKWDYQASDGYDCGFVERRES